MAAESKTDGGVKNRKEEFGSARGTFTVRGAPGYRNEKPSDSYDDDYEIDEDGHRSPWCRQFEVHNQGNAHEFCGHHQISWCRLCDRQCPACVDDPVCPDCGCHLFEEYHDWDCCCVDEDGDD